MGEQNHYRLVLMKGKRKRMMKGKRKRMLNRPPKKKSRSRHLPPKKKNRNRHLPPKKIRLRKRRIPPAMSKRGPRRDVDNGHSKRNVALLANCVSRKIWFVVCTQNLCGTRAWIPMVAPFGAITCTQGGGPIMTTISIAG